MTDTKRELNRIMVEPGQTWVGNRNSIAAGREIVIIEAAGQVIRYRLAGNDTVYRITRESLYRSHLPRGYLHLSDAAKVRDGGPRADGVSRLIRDARDGRIPHFLLGHAVIFAEADLRTSRRCFGPDICNVRAGDLWEREMEDDDGRFQRIQIDQVDDETVSYHKITEGTEGHVRKRILLETLLANYVPAGQMMRPKHLRQMLAEDPLLPDLEGMGGLVRAANAGLIPSVRVNGRLFFRISDYKLDLQLDGRLTRLGRWMTPGKPHTPPAPLPEPEPLPHAPAAEAWQVLWRGAGGAPGEELMLLRLAPAGGADTVTVARSGEGRRA